MANKKPLCEEVMNGDRDFRYYSEKDVKLAIQNIERRLKEYEDHKISLMKNNQEATDDEKLIHITCCIDTKMFFEQLLNEEIGTKECELRNEK